MRRFRLNLNGLLAANEKIASRKGREGRKDLEGLIPNLAVAPAGHSSTPGGAAAGPWRPLREEKNARPRDFALLWPDESGNSQRSKKRGVA